MKASIRFFLYKTQRAKTQSVVCAISWEGKRLRFATGLTVEPSAWDTKKQRVKRTYRNSAAHNSEFDGLAARATLFLSRNDDAPVLPDELRAYLLSEKSGTAPTHADNLTHLYDLFLSDQKDLITKGTARVHMNAKTHLLAFVKQRGLSGQLSEINILFFTDLVKYLYSELNDLRNCVSIGIQGSNRQNSKEYLG